MGRRRKEVVAEEVVEPAADAVEVEPAQAPETVIVAEYHEEVPAKPPTKWIVLEDTVVSLFGQMTTLSAGTIVSAKSYGPLGVKRIMEQGVMLEPVG